MNRYFVRFPGFRRKALTLSYDDGVLQDRKLIEIMDRYGIKGTFNLNGGTFCDIDYRGSHERLNKEEAVKLYKDSGHEVAVHGFRHPFLDEMPEGSAAWEIVKDREILEEIFGGIVRGCAYPMGTFDDEVVSTLRQCGIAYARRVGSSRSFDIPKDWLRLQGTCRNVDPDLFDICDRFLDLKPTYGPKLFYMWGHSYEFDRDNGWQIIEDFCRKMGGQEDIWYATNIEIYDYLEAARRIRSTADSNRLYNPTCTPVYLKVDRDRLVRLEPGEMTDI